MTSPRADVAGREAAAARECAWTGVCGAREARGRYQRRVERMLVRQKLQLARGGACDAISGRSWLGFARD